MQPHAPVPRFIDAKSRPSMVEKLFLTVGMLCFFAMGGVVFSAIDQVPADLHVNGIVLGCLSFAVALLMLIDLADPMARHTSDHTQTDFVTTTTSTTFEEPASQQTQPLPPHAVQPIVAKETNIRVDHTEHPSSVAPMIHHHQHHPHSVHPQLPANPTVELVPVNGQYTRADTVDYVHARSLPTAQQPATEHVRPTPSAHPPAFEQLLLPEKQRPHRHQHVADTRGQLHQPDQLQYSNLTVLQEHSRRPAPPPRPVPPPVPHRSGHPQHTSAQQQHQRQQHHQPSPPSHQLFAHRQSSAVAHRQPNIGPSAAASQRNHRSSDRRRKSRARCDSSDDEQQPTAIQPGFVAHAARFWDQRAQQQNSELNTIV